MSQSLQRMFVLLCFCLIPHAVFAETVAFYFGKTPSLMQLCHHDWVVFDPAVDLNMHEYCQSTSLPLAYVSVGEVRKGVDDENKINPHWVMGTNPAWNNNLVIDQTQAGWQDFLMKRIIQPLWEKGYRGFFLDTLDSYQLAVHDNVLQKKQIMAMVQFILQIKQQYPQAKIILNRGFTLLPFLQHHEIDAVVIESLYHGWNQAKQQYEPTSQADQTKLFQEIDTLNAMHLPVIIIDYLPPEHSDQASTLANHIKQQRMTPWITDKSLQHIYLPKPNLFARQVLVLFSHEQNIPLMDTPAIRYLGSAIEYLGYIPDYYALEKNTLSKPSKGYYFSKDVIKKFENSDLKTDYSGIILWIDSTTPNNLPLMQWAKKQIDAGIPVLFLHGLGLPIDNPFLKQLGFEASAIQPSKHPLKISKLDQNFVGFETQPTQIPYDFFPIKSNGAHVLLQLKNDQQQTQDAVAITRWGGYALEPYLIQFLPDATGLWILNPYTFLPKALKLTAIPAPDTTTENGRRLLSVHVDGERFADPSKSLNGQIAAVEFLEKILKRFQIPTSVSVISKELAPDGINPKQSTFLMQVARTIFALPWVESASYFNSHHEILNSVAFINQYLAPKNKPCQLFFWSNLAHPNADDLAQLNQNNILNINGLSDTHPTNFSPSLTAVRPKGLKIGKNYQIFAPIDMDLYYIHDFAGPLYGFNQVIETFKLTDEPRRLKHMDIYYHLYTASYPATLQALVKVYQYALSQPVMMIYISDYIKKVLDFYHLQMRVYEGAWEIETHGDLRELRIDKEMGFPDLEKSSNVVGFRDHHHDRYIHLGPSRLSMLRLQQQNPSSVYLIEANARVTAFKRDGKDLKISFEGNQPVALTLANIAKCQVISQSPLEIKKQKNGHFHYQSTRNHIEIHIAC